MTNVKTWQKTNDILYKSLLDNRITHADVDLCVMQRLDEIDSIMNIFDHKTTRDCQLVFELMGLLAQDQREEVMAFHDRQYNFSIRPDFSRDDVVLLLTSCLYNPAFFSFALSICECIKSRIENDSSEKYSSVIIVFVPLQTTGKRQINKRNISEYTAIAATEKSTLELALFTPKQRELFKVSSVRLNLNKKYIRIAFQAEKNPIDSQNFIIEISKEGYNQKFSLTDAKKQFRGKEWIITLDIKTWQGSLLGTEIKCIEEAYLE